MSNEQVSDIQVMQSNAGFYLGYSYFDDETQAWLPYSRETEYMTEGEAVNALKYWEEGC